VCSQNYLSRLLLRFDPGISCSFQSCAILRLRPIGLQAQHGNTALMNAIDNGNDDCVRLLLEAGADKDARNPNVRSLGLFAAILEIYFSLGYPGYLIAFDVCSTHLLIE
jgi:ankyrin repeat protein